MSYQQLKPRKRGKKWEVRWREGEARPAESFDSYAAALTFADQKRKDLRAGKPSPVAGQLFGSVVDLYIEKKEIPQRADTNAAYLSFIKCHIRPRWEKQPIARLVESPLEIRSWLENLPLAPKTKVHIRSIMYRLFDTAMLYKVIPQGRNPIEFVRLKSGKRSKVPKILTADQCRTIRKNLPAPYSIMLLVVQCFGLRASEMLALKWSDFDFAGGTVTISRGIVSGVLGDCKTEYSAKPLPMCEEVAKVLLCWREATQFAKDEDWVFASPFSAGQMPYAYTPIRERLPKGIGLHTFRHTYRSLLSKRGTPMGVQKDLLRQSDIRTTMNVYGGTLTEDMREAHTEVSRMVM